MTLKQFCFSFQGRINRKMYWIYLVVSIVMTLVVGLIGVALEDGDAPPEVFLFMAPFIIVKLIIDIAVTVKRLHDTNRNGALWLMGFLPVIGAFYLIIVCGVIASTDGDNKYGAPPVNKLI